MRLTAKPITTFSNINSFSYSNQWIVRAGDPNTLYFQIVDLDQNGLRYLAGIGIQNQPASIQITFPSIDDINVIKATATQDPNDKSIWSVNIGPNQRPGSGAVIFQITENTTVRRFSVTNMLTVEQPISGSC